MGNAENWKWWYFVVAGVLIAGIGAYYISEARVSKAIGSFVLAALCIAIGLFSKASEGKSQQ
jgi:hypothetical protein